MEYEITPLLVGVRQVDQGIMTYQRMYGRRIWLPMWSFLIRGNGRAMLVDTGLDDFVAPPEFIAETGLDAQLMPDALAAAGLSPDDIDTVINTHLHDDHCGHNPLFTKAEFRVQQREIDFCHNPHPLDYRYDPDFIEGIDVKPVDGDHEVAPGIELFLTPGHTVGSQTIRVNTARGKFIIPGFCCNKENFPAAGPAACPGVHCDAYLAYDTAQRVKAMEGTVLPLHELSVPQILAG